MAPGHRVQWAAGSQICGDRIHRHDELRPGTDEHDDSTGNKTPGGELGERPGCAGAEMVHARL